MTEPSATKLLPADHAESIAFWGNIFPEDSGNGLLLNRLIISIYDYARNTSFDSVPQMENHKAYSYLTSFVMLTVTKMFHSDALTAQELKGVVSQGFEGLDDLLTAYYRTYAIPYITIILAKEGRLLIDPKTEEPWKYLIPRSAWMKNGALPNGPLNAKLQELEPVWKETRQRILNQYHRAALQRDAETRQAAQNAAAMSAANAQLAAAQMRTRAIESGFQTMGSVFDPPGTRYVYQRRDDPGNF